MGKELSLEELRALSKRLSELLPPNLAFALVVWPSGEPTDCGYFSNVHRAEVLVAVQRLLGAIQQPKPLFSTQERELLVAAGCGWVLERLEDSRLDKAGTPTERDT